MEINYKEKYRNLKRHVKNLLLEQESFQSELESTQRRLLRISRDKSFLLDRLLKYEQITEDSPPDSDATLPSDGDEEPPKPKKKKVSSTKNAKNKEMIEKTKESSQNDEIENSSIINVETSPVKTEVTFNNSMKNSQQLNQTSATSG